MKIEPENVTKIQALVAKFAADLSELGGSVDEGLDNDGQKVLYLGLYAFSDGSLCSNMTDRVED